MSRWLLILMLFVVSPLTLHITRLASVIVVGALISLAYISRPPQVAKFRVEKIALIFFLFMGTNVVVAIISGNRWVDAVGEIVPIAEVFGCFILTARVRFDEPLAWKWLKCILWCVMARSAWELLLIFTGSSVISPIYGEIDRYKAEVTISNFTYIRPIDPIAGIFVPIALILYAFGVHRTLTKWIIIAAGTVSLLGLTRSEWIASTACMLMLLAFARRHIIRQVLVGTACISFATYLLTMVVPDFREFVQTRLVNYTVQQAISPKDELQALRFLELYTAAEKFEQAPLLGHGLGSGFGTVVFNGSELQFVQFHNYYLNLLSNAGLVGVFMLLVVVWNAMRFVLRLYSASRIDIERAIVICAGASLLWWGIFVAFQPIYSSYHVTVLIGALFGMAQSLVLHKHNQTATVARV
jgi:hypothetical protein